MQEQNVQIRFHQIAGIGCGWLGSKRNGCRHLQKLTPRLTGSRSSVQNCSDAMVAFQMPYSHAISQYSTVSMVLCKMLENSKVSWYEEHVGEILQ